MKEFFTKVWAWIGADGMQHFTCSALIVFAFGWLSPVWVALLVGASFGIAKEVWDLSRAGWDVRAFDWKHTGHDLACDLAGLVFGFALVLLYLSVSR